MTSARGAEQRGALVVACSREPEGVGRMAISVRGIVHGVGFRPFVYRLASRLSLVGFVKNRTADVLIEVEGGCASLQRFVEELARRPPALARIEAVRCESLAARGGRDFSIESSEVGVEVAAPLAPDAALCAACLREVLDPADRRHRHPFAACTDCGPRFTIATGAPYDRERTTMARFPPCAACRAEYGDPLDRRFHAQPIACHECGPRLALLDAAGASAAADPLAAAARALCAGAIVAVKGIGGYHLACDAYSEEAVAELRRRKHRDAKPFAVMVADVSAAEALCQVSSAERALLESPAAPIVLLQRRQHAVASAVAPDVPWLGLMLAYTPLHHLLLREVEARRAARSPALVMTSGNAADEPIAHRDADARSRLVAVADLFLMHDRDIENRCDDSVVRMVGSAPSWLRRSRGHAPAALPLPRPLRVPTLALGGQLKATFALGLDHQARLSHHLGDLDDAGAYRAFVAAIDRYQALFGIRPSRLVHDLHPDYASTRYALARALGEGLEAVAVQHHHAHVASCAAEHGLAGPVIGIAFDGSGHGADAAVWGGEVLWVDGARARRVAHLAPVAQPGGDHATRAPWRMAVAHLVHAGVDARCVPALRAVPDEVLSPVARLCRRASSSAGTSSAGRLFDAVAALLDPRFHRVSFEGQAAMWLEGLALAGHSSSEPPYPIELRQEGEASLLDPAPMVRSIVRDIAAGVSPATIAARFHAALAEVTVRACVGVAERTGIGDVVASGGCLVNAVLAEALRRRLEAAGLRAFFHREIPANDGGLCFGQLAVAAALDAEGR